MGNISGINEVKLDNLVLDIYDYTDKVNQILNNIDELILKSSNYFKCDSSDYIRNRYQQLAFNYTTLKQNMLNCANDLIKVKHHYQNIDSDVKQVAQKGISNINFKGGDNNE